MILYKLPWIQTMFLPPVSPPPAFDCDISTSSIGYNQASKISLALSIGISLPVRLDLGPNVISVTVGDCLNCDNVHGINDNFTNQYVQ